MNATIEQVCWDTHAARLYAIRHAVFVVEQQVPESLERDEHDAGALHLLASIPGTGDVGTARMLGNGHIGRMAVLPAWRGRGIGSALLRRMITVAGERGLHQVQLHAQCRAEGFYRQFGFVPEGEVFVDAGIDHRCMRLRLDGQPG